MSTKTLFNIKNAQGGYDEYLFASSADIVTTIGGSTVQAHIDDAVIHLTAAEKAKLGNLSDNANSMYATKSELAGMGANFVVQTIAERNALSGAVVGTIAYVVDATADTSVTSGGATYIYNATSWTKISEWESMDLVLTWNSIQGRPTSTVSDIDDAVSKKHTHVNTTTLDDLGAASTRLTFRSKEVAYIEDVTNQVVVSTTQPSNQFAGGIWIKTI